MLYIQNIFIPDENKLKIIIKSITSLANYLKNDPYNIDIYIGGYVKNDEYWQKINESSQQLKNKTLKRFDKNFGKAYVTNHLINEIQSKKQYKYILLADYDIIFLAEEKHLFQRLIESSVQTEKYKKKPFGMIALNQKENNCHLPESKQRIFTYINQYNQKECIVWNDYPGYIGGGCIFTSINAWNKVNGYRIMGVYTGDDAYYLLDMKNHGFTWQLLETLYVIHSKDTDNIYNDFKWEICKRITDGNNKEDQLNTYIKQMNEFWANRK